jgi:hypothetical protein
MPIVADTAEWEAFVSGLDKASQLKYQNAVSDYLSFCESHSWDVASSESLFKYLGECHEPDDEEGIGYAASTLWSYGSMIGRFFLKAFKLKGVLLPWKEQLQKPYRLVLLVYQPQRLIVRLLKATTNSQQ